MPRLFWLFLLCLLVLACSPAHAAEPLTSTGRFEFKQAGKTVPVWYFVPEHATPDMKIVIVMHGVGRDASRYRNDWKPLAEQGRFILVAPEFSNTEFPGNDLYSSGGMKSGKMEPTSSYAFIEPIFDEVKRATGNHSARYLLFGHSAGSQFVHRYLWFMPQARVETAVAANAGWWTLPDRGIDFPYGLRGSSIDDAMLKTMLGRKLFVLLGTADTDPEDEHLRRAPEAMAQGPYRLARGHTFFEAGKKAATALGVPFGWKLETAPDIGHSDAGMAKFAVPLLLEKE